MGAIKWQVGEQITKTMADNESLTSAGYVLTISAGSVVKAGNGDVPLGVATKSTEDPLNDGTFLEGEEVPVLLDGVARVMSESGVSAGMPIVVSDDGKVSGATGSDAENLVGTSVSDESDGFIYVHLR